MAGKMLWCLNSTTHVTQMCCATSLERATWSWRSGNASETARLPIPLEAHVPLPPPQENKTNSLVRKKHAPRIHRKLEEMDQRILRVMRRKNSWEQYVIQSVRYSDCTGGEKSPMVESACLSWVPELFPKISKDQTKRKTVRLWLWERGDKIITPRLNRPLHLWMNSLRSLKSCTWSSFWSLVWKAMSYFETVWSPSGEIRFPL